MPESTRSGKTGTLFWLPVILDDERFDAVQTLLLVELADHVGDQDTCFVGIKRLAKAARCSYSTAQRRLAGLEAMGVIARQPSHRPDGSRGVDTFQLQRSAFVTALPTGQADQGSGHSSDQGHRSLGDNAEPPRTEPPLENTPEQAQASLSDGFEDFWENYLRKESKGKARKVWTTRRKQGVPAEELIQAGANYMRKCKIQRTEVKFIKLAATFLGPDEHWKDYLGDGAAMADVQYLRAVGDTIYDETPVVYS